MKRLFRSSVVGVGGAQPWQGHAPPPAPADVDGFFIGFDDVAQALTEVPPVDAPTDYSRLSLPVVCDIVRDMQTRRLRLLPGESVGLAYLPTGRFLVGEHGIDTFG